VVRESWLGTGLPFGIRFIAHPRKASCVNLVPNRGWGATLKAATNLYSSATDGDTLVRFVHDDILATGDYFRTVGYPRMDLVNGGSLKGLIDGLALTISVADANTKIVPGHGPLADRSAIMAQRDMLLTIRQRVAAFIAEGKTIDEIIAARPTADYDAKVPEGAQGSDAFLKSLYSELRANP